MAMGKSDQHQAKSKKKDQDTLPTKVVIRRLPPSITVEKLKQELDGMPEYDYLRLVPPDYSLAPHVFCRAYINFKNFENVLQFRNSYDGYIFNEGKGNEYSAVIELSSYQGIPKESKKRKDAKCGTIHKDPDYEAFLENFNKKVEPLPSAEVYLEAMESRKADKKSAVTTLTPLVEFLNKKRAARNLSRNAAAMLENDRKIKREKENLKEYSKLPLKGSKMDHKSSSKDGRKDRSDSSSKSSQDRKTNDSRRKEDRRERKPVSGRRSRNERDHKEPRKDGKKETDDRPLSARSDSSRYSDDRSSRREDRRQKDDRRDRDKDRRKAPYEKGESKDSALFKILEDSKKGSRTAAVKGAEKSQRRNSIEYEDPSIVAFGKITSKKESNNGESKRSEDRNGTDDVRNKDRDRSGRDDTEDSGRRIKNKDRPAMKVYRPPVARMDRGKSKVDDRSSNDKYRVKSPENSRSPEKRDRTSEKSHERDRPRSRPKQTSEKTGDREFSKVKEKEREEDRSNDKDMKSREKETRKD